MRSEYGYRDRGTVDRGDACPGPRVVTEPLAVSLAAQLGVLPVLLIAFDGVPLITPVSNVLAAPAAEALGVYGLVASAAGGLMPRFAPLVQQPTTVLVRWVTFVAQVGASLPIRLDRRGAAGCVAIAAVVASVACVRVRGNEHRVAVPDTAGR